MELQYLQRYYGVTLSEKDMIKYFNFKYEEYDSDDDNDDKVNDNVENDNENNDDVDDNGSITSVFNDDDDENYQEFDVYEQLEELNNKLSEKYKNIKIYKYPECYFDNGDDREYYLGIHVDYIKIKKLSDLLGYLAGRDSKTAINEVFFSKKIGDTKELFEVLKEYNINKTPLDLIVPNECGEC